MTILTRKFVDGPFGQVHLRMCGTPNDQPPLICLHQSPKSSREFVKILPHLADHRFCIAIDSPGHGESDLPPSEADATIENYAKSALAVIDELGYKSVDLLGHHTGAKVAVEIAFQRPEIVRNILMISALVLSQEEQNEFKDMFQPIPLDEAGTRFNTMWERAIKYRGPGLSLKDLAASYAENLRAGEAYEWGHQAAFNYNAHFPERVKELPHRITVINPGDMLYELTPRVLPLLQNGELVDKPEWGFGFMDSDSQNAAQLILSKLI